MSEMQLEAFYNVITGVFIIAFAALVWWLIYGFVGRKSPPASSPVSMSWEAQQYQEGYRFARSLHVTDHYTLDELDSMQSRVPDSPFHRGVRGYIHQARIQNDG